MKGRDTGIKDMHGNAIHEGDTLRFVDKAEWYGTDLFKFVITGQRGAFERAAFLDAKPYRERKVEYPDLSWLLSKDIQEWWEVVSVSEAPDD